MGTVAGRVAVVTGAGNGIGAAHARLLSSQGALVVVNDVAGDAADNTVAEIERSGDIAVADCSDIATNSGAAALIETALSNFGRVDIAVNNAGILRDRSFTKMSYDEWDAVLKVHLYGAFNVCQAAWGHMREQRFGRIIMTASQAGFYGNFGQANYAAAKMGQIGLMNALAIEGKKYNILVNAVSPTAATQMTRGLIAEETLGRLDPAYAAPVVAHLASEELTETGLVILASGLGYSRVAIFKTPNVMFDRPPDPNELSGEWANILDLSRAEPGAPLVATTGTESGGGSQ